MGNSNVKNALTLAWTLVFVGITYLTLARPQFSPSFYLGHLALYLAAAVTVGMETGYLFAILSTISGVGAIAALKDKALSPWLAAEMALIWALAAWVAYFDRRIKTEELEGELARHQGQKNLAEFHREIQTYENRISHVQAQADLRQRLSSGITLLGKSLSPAEIQNALKEAVKLNFPGCSVGISWFHPDQPPDPFELWVKDSRNSLLVADTYKDDRFRSYFEKGGMAHPYRSMALSPLEESASPGRRGILKVQSEEPGRLTREDARIVDLYARLGNLALGNAGLHQQAQDLAVHDPLTGLYTRKIFDERLERECAHASRFKADVSVALVDIDHFKRVNDTYGHLTGDKILVWAAGLLRQGVREVDFVARYGGEEFVVIFPEARKDQAAALLDRIRGYIESTGLPVDGKEIRVTISVGIASYPGETTSPRQLLRAADERLYVAKGGGRNRIVIS